MIIQQKNKSVLFFYFMQILILLFSIFYLILSSNEYKVSVFFSIILFLLILSFLFFKRDKFLFEPIILFSIFYLTVCFTIWYSVATNFESNIYINNTSFKGNFSTLLSFSSFYYLVGYICAVLGYYSIKKVINENGLDFKVDNIKLPNSTLNIFIFIFLLIGITNFAYNVWHFASGNLFVYMSNISIRKYEFAEGGTTIGYLFAYYGMFIWLYKILKNNQKVTFLFWIMLGITMVLKFSQGRIFQFLLYLFTFIAIYYFVKLRRDKKVNNKKFIGIGMGVLLFGILFYILRVMSNLAYNNKIQGSFFDTMKILIQDLGYYAFDKGNTPNIALMPKIIDSWAEDIGYLYGTSFFTWIFQIIPDEFGLGNFLNKPSVLIKQTWFSEIQGGNLPPTGVGEMYANFGPIGPFIGMFFFGILSKLIYNFTVKNFNYWIFLIYIQITIGFIALYPKGEFDNISVWSIIPPIMIYFTFTIISKVYKKTTI